MSQKRQKMTAVQKKQALLSARKVFKQVETIVKVNREDLSNPESNMADKALMMQNKAYANIKNVIGTGGREAVTDASNFRSLSGATVRQAFALGRKFQKINCQNFLANLASRRPANGGSTRIDWEELGQEVGVFFRGIPRGHHLHGPIHVDLVAKKKIVQRREKKVIHAEEAPVDLAADGEEMEENMHSVARHAVTKALDRATFKGKRRADDDQDGASSGIQKTGAIDFLFDPQSFSSTVSNIFDFSMLIKDGTAAIELDKEKLPRVYARKGGGNNKHPKQAVVAFTVKDFEDLVQDFHINGAMLKNVDDEKSAKQESKKAVSARKGKKPDGKGKKRSGKKNASPAKKARKN